MNDRLLRGIDYARDQRAMMLWARLLSRRSRVKMRVAETVREWGVLEYASMWRDLGGES